MGFLRELKLEVAVSLYLSPCSEEELIKRDFLHNYSLEWIGRIIMDLEKEALFYRCNVMHIYKAWAKKNLTEYDLDFRTPREKAIDGMTEFAKNIYRL